MVPSLSWMFQCSNPEKSLILLKLSFYLVACHCNSRERVNICLSQVFSKKQIQQLPWSHTTYIICFERPLVADMTYCVFQAPHIFTTFAPPHLLSVSTYAFKTGWIMQKALVKSGLHFQAHYFFLSTSLHVQVAASSVLAALRRMRRRRP